MLLQTQRRISTPRANGSAPSKDDRIAASFWTPDAIATGRDCHVIRATPEALAELDRAIHAWSSSAETLSNQARAVVKRFLTDAESQVRDRAARVRAIEEALRSARGEERARLAREAPGRN